MDRVNKPIKLVAIDLDGTVVSHTLGISDAVIAGLKRAQSEFGCKVVIATGRMFPSTIPFAQKLGTQQPVVSYQGAMIRDISTMHAEIDAYPVLYHQGLPLDLAGQILDVIQRKGYHANVYVKDVLYTNELNEKAWYYKNITGVTPIEAKDFASILTDTPSKIMLIEEQCERIMQDLKAQFGEAINVCVSRKDFCEIVDARVSKWEAITQLLALWGLSPDDVLAIGDQENDLSMIQGAGLGVAMGNAPLHVQAHADYVTRDVESDGVLHALQKFVFNE